MNEGVVRCALDVGSGSTKIKVGLVKDSKILKILHAKETELFIVADSKKNDGVISGPMQSRLLSLLSEYKAEALKLGATQFAAVATEIFRYSKNGADVLKLVHEQTGILVNLVSQELEGELGFMTAVAKAGKGQEEIISWDSGGASFQIVGSVNQELVVYSGSLGAGNTAKALIEIVQHKVYNTTPTPSTNPVSPQEADQLVEWIQSTLLPVPDWLKQKLEQKNEVVSIGGGTSCFQVVHQIIGKSNLTKEDIKDAISKTVNLTDEGMSQWGIELQKDIVVPKLCLMLAVMEKLNISQFTHHFAIGSTSGMLIKEQLYI